MPSQLPPHVAYNQKSNQPSVADCVIHVQTRAQVCVYAQIRVLTLSPMGANQRHQQTLPFVLSLEESGLSSEGLLAR